MTDALAIIPARGGSKGVPRKNVLPLAGVPLIAYTIRAAHSAERVTRVVVSTDDAEVADVSRTYGAEVVMRPAELSSDTARSEDALLHVLDNLKSSEDYVPDLVVFLQCTSPLTLPGDIDATIHALEADGADTALAVTAFHGFLWQSDANGAAKGINHDERVRLMRQQREPEFLETGAVYVMRAGGFREHRRRFFGRTALHEIPIARVLEIDGPYDVTRAEERLAAVRRNTEPFSGRPVLAFAMDFDGVHTDDRVLVDEEGREAVLCSRRDGMGIELLRTAGLPMIVISKERVGVVAKRCAKLGISYLHGEDDKLSKLSQWLEDIGVPMTQTVYMGNDVNDIDCLHAAGIGVAPADAHPEALAAADFILMRRGGEGALRELTDKILDQRADR